MEAAAVPTPPPSRRPDFDPETVEALRAIRSHAAAIIIDPRGHCQQAKQIRRLASALLNGAQL